MIEIGGKPILWHIMKIYSAHGVNDFVICCGYKGYVIKEYFANYFLHMSDVTFDMRSNRCRSTSAARRALEGDPGRHRRSDHDRRPPEARRELPARREPSASPMATAWRRRHHRADRSTFARPLATVTAVQPPGRFGALDARRRAVTGFRKSRAATAAGSMAASSCCRRRCSTYIDGDATIWEASRWRTWRATAS
jgi:glucose-1-phosphate cytidylyltransferase